MSCNPVICGLSVENLLVAMAILLEYTGERLQFCMKDIGPVCQDGEHRIFVGQMLV
jgi:hypothetical protein